MHRPRLHLAIALLAIALSGMPGRGIAAGYTFRAIARGLNRAVSTVSQEVARHGGQQHYRAAQADLAAWDSARRPKPCLLH